MRVNLDTGYLKTITAMPTTGNVKEGMIFDAVVGENPAMTAVEVTESNWYAITFMPASYANAEIHVYDRIPVHTSVTIDSGCCSPSYPLIVDFGPDLTPAFFGGKQWKLTHNAPQIILAVPGVYQFAAIDVTDEKNPFPVNDTSDPTTQIFVRYRKISPFQYPPTYFAGV